MDNQKAKIKTDQAQLIDKSKVKTKVKTQDLTKLDRTQYWI